MNPDSATNTIAVELHDIRFTYDSGATWALDGVNLRYPLLFALSLCALALALYRVDRLRLVTST